MIKLSSLLITGLVSNNLCDVKEPTHCSKRVGDFVSPWCGGLSLHVSLISSVSLGGLDQYID